MEHEVSPGERANNHQIIASSIVYIEREVWVGESLKFFSIRDVNTISPPGSVLSLAVPPP